MAPLSACWAMGNSKPSRGMGLFLAIASYRRGVCRLWIRQSSRPDGRPDGIRCTVVLFINPLGRSEWGLVIGNKIGIPATECLTQVGWKLAQRLNARCLSAPVAGVAQVLEPGGAQRLRGKASQA